ncbi:MAG TPA: pilus assembly protein TadG-related protein [Nocardioidaceae bacterium]|nr:pilus assembly protein TadG-related protein [Nocardioidaceae bacterium]
MREERGQTALLIMGLFLVSVLLVGVVVDASAAFLRRQSLTSLADGAALAAADGVQGEQVYSGGLGELALIDPAVARDYVVDYLAASGAAADFPGLQFVVRTEADSVTVRLAAPMDLPIPPPGFAEQAQVVAESSSVVLVG